MNMISKMLAVGAFAALIPGAAHADDTMARVEGSRAVAKAFGSQLVGELQDAMKRGGPVEAIKTCNVAAPAVALAQGQARGWKVGRTSLKVRNPASEPDGWERHVLEQFAERAAKGEDPAAMEAYDVVEENGGRTFRYMKAIAIPAGAPCVTCHGKEIDPAVAKALTELYPNDRATGYAPGDLRGAFTIRQPM
ncbi:MAG TPA: DUF3365 domain-containing protein [Azospirillum sp.]|nr:DUF3365 domain-containing protein [Azospirillum sp.]